VVRQSINAAGGVLLLLLLPPPPLTDVVNRNNFYVVKTLIEKAPNTRQSHTHAHTHTHTKASAAPCVDFLIFTVAESMVRIFTITY